MKIFEVIVESIFEVIVERVPVGASSILKEFKVWKKPLGDFLEESQSQNLEKFLENFYGNFMDDFYRNL